VELLTGGEGIRSSRADDQNTSHSFEAARNVLAKYEKSAKAKQTKTRTGRVLHLECLVALAKAGPATVPALVDALTTDSADIRAFAAEALGFLGDAKTKAALAQAVEDKDWGVRMSAIKSLGRLGMETTAKFRQVAQTDESVGIRFEMTYALTRDDKPNPEAIRKALSNYDMNRLHSTRYGKPAPDVTLADTTRKVWRLRDLRDKKSVVLVFLAGTT
jgi:HEAT repeat protein